MSARDWMRRLDRRAEAYGTRLQWQYDVEPPVWLKQSGTILIFVIAAVSMMLALTAGPVVAALGTAALLLAYVVVLFSWTRRHRVRG